MYMEMELGLVWHTGHSDQSADESNHVWWGRSASGFSLRTVRYEGREESGRENVQPRDVSGMCAFPISSFAWAPRDPHGTYGWL